MAEEVTVTSKNFETEVLKSKVPVLADFWADWCVPCKMIAPVLEQIAAEYDGKLKVAKVNVDQESEIASRYNIVSIPTLILFKDGEVADQHVGAGSKQQIEGIFKDQL